MTGGKLADMHQNTTASTTAAAVGSWNTTLSSAFAALAIVFLPSFRVLFLKVERGGSRRASGVGSPSYVCRLGPSATF